MFCYLEQSQQPQPDASVPRELRAVRCSPWSTCELLTPEARFLWSAVFLLILGWCPSVPAGWTSIGQCPTNFLSGFAVMVSSLQWNSNLCKQPPGCVQEWHFSSPNKMWHLMAELPSKWVLQGIRSPQSYEIVEIRRNREFLLKTNPVCMKMRKLELYPSKS